MTRETKLGLVVASAFVALTAVVVISRLKPGREVMMKIVPTPAVAAGKSPDPSMNNGSSAATPIKGPGSAGAQGRPAQVPATDGAAQSEDEIKRAAYNKQVKTELEPRKLPDALPTYPPIKIDVENPGKPFTLPEYGDNKENPPGPSANNLAGLPGYSVFESAYARAPVQVAQAVNPNASPMQPSLPQQANPEVQPFQIDAAVNGTPGAKAGIGPDGAAPPSPGQPAGGGNNLTGAAAPPPPVPFTLPDPTASRPASPVVANNPTPLATPDPKDVGKPSVAPIPTTTPAPPNGMPAVQPVMAPTQPLPAAAEANGKPALPTPLPTAPVNENANKVPTPPNPAASAGTPSYVAPGANPLPASGQPTPGAGGLNSSGSDGFGKAVNSIPSAPAAAPPASGASATPVPSPAVPVVPQPPIPSQVATSNGAALPGVAPQTVPAGEPKTTAGTPAPFGAAANANTTVSPVPAVVPSNGPDNPRGFASPAPTTVAQATQRQGNALDNTGLPPVGGSPNVISPSIPVPSPTDTSRPAGGALPPVKVIDVRTHACESADTSYDTLSQRFYGSSQYGEALRRFNLECYGGTDDLRPGTKVQIPANAKDLESYAPQGLPGSPAPAARPAVEPIPVKSSSRKTQSEGVSPPVVAVTPSVGTPLPVRAPAANERWQPQATSAPTGSPGSTGKVYRVPAGGEPLYLIAQRTLGDGKRWPEIYRLNRVNPEQVIPEGTVLALPEDARRTP